MEQTPNQDDFTRDVLSRILAAPQPVVLLRGPAGCGKTTVALAMYRHGCKSAGSSCCLLAPNAATHRRMLDQLRAGTPGGVLLAPRVTTFAGLAGTIMAARGDSARAIGPFQRHMLLRKIVSQAARNRQFQALAAVADTPGLIRTLDRAIAELKRAAVDPDDLARAVGETRGKSRDLLLVYQQYQRRLKEMNLFDIEGQMWQGRDHLRTSGQDAESLGLAGVTSLVADGFTDFTPTQIEMLSLLSSLMGRIVITLPFADDDRDRMWRWTRRTRDRLLEAFGDDVEEIVLPARPQQGDLTEKLFSYDAPAAEPDGGLNVIAAAGVDSEVATVARRIKRRLLSPDAANQRIAVLARSLDAYRPAVERIFTEYQIPIRFAPASLTEIPVVRFCLDVAAVSQGDFEYSQVLRVIKSSYFRPQALGKFTSATSGVAEMIIRRGNVLAGRDSYAAAAERISLQPAVMTADDEIEPIDLGPLRANSDDITAAATMLNRLFDIASAASSPAGMIGLIDALGLQQPDCPSMPAEYVARDLRALAALRGALENLPDVAPKPEHLADALSQISLPAPRGESLVDVFDVLDARAMRWDHVFLLGCGEGQFPLRFSETSLLSEADRQNWDIRGVHLDCRSDLTAREMLLFYLAASRADLSLTLSYRHSDAGGKASAPGSFLLSLLEPFGGIDALRTAGRLETVPPGRFSPPAGQAASPDEALIAAVTAMFKPDCPDNDGAIAFARAELPLQLRRVAMGLWAGYRRWLPGPCNEFDGRLNDPDLRAMLATRYPRQTVFSASQLSTFGQCPWEYFAKYVLHLAPLEEPERQLQAVSRGIFCHDVLFRVFTDLAERHGRPVVLADLAEDVILEALDRAVAAAGKRFESDKSPYPLLWDIQRRQIQQMLRQYLLAQRNETALRPQCLHFELAFGTDDAETDRTDPASRAEPVTIETAAGPVALRGKIDRIDRVIFGEQTGLLIVDYKTGALPKSDESLDARNTQMPLYIAAVEQIFDEPCLGGVFHGLADGKTSWFAGMKLSRGKFREVENFPDMQSQALAAVAGSIKRMQAGQFDILPYHSAVEKYSPYRQINHYSPARSEVKTPAPAKKTEIETEETT